MSIIVAIKFPVPPAQANAALAANPGALAPLGEAMEKFGGKFLLRLEHDNEFIDLDEWPSLEDYQAFKAEAQAVIDAFEAALGTASTEEIWTAWRPDFS